MKSPERLERELEEIEQKRGENGLKISLPLKIADINREISRAFTACQQKLNDTNILWLADKEEENLKEIKAKIKSALKSWMQAMDKTISSCEVIANFDFSVTTREKLFDLFNNIKFYEISILNKIEIFPFSRLLPADFNPETIFQKSTNYLEKLIARAEKERGPQQLPVFSPANFPELYHRIPLFPPKPKLSVSHVRGKKPQV